MLNKIRLAIIFLCIFLMINAFAENPTSENYKLLQSNLFTGNDPADPPVSLNYILQSSTIDLFSGEEVVSGNYSVLPGYYHGEILGEILAPENVTISIDGVNVQLSWDPVPNATYKVYSSDDPIADFIEDTSGTLINESWIAPIPTGKKFYYVKSLNLE